MRLLEQRWLRYARDVVTDVTHHEACTALGGSLQRDGFAADVRWPGYLGSGYSEGGILLVANVHTRFDAAPGVETKVARAAEAAVRQWRDAEIEDEAFLEIIRRVYEEGLQKWRVTQHARKVLRALGVPVAAVAYANAARCQTLDTGVALQKACLARWPLQQLMAMLRPGLLLLQSETARSLRARGEATWPCLTVTYSQRNGLLTRASPWQPEMALRAQPRLETWLPELVAAWSRSSSGAAVPAIQLGVDDA